MKDIRLKTLGCGTSPKLFGVEDADGKLQGRWRVEKTEAPVTMESYQPGDLCSACREQKGRGNRRLLTVDPVSLSDKKYPRKGGESVLVGYHLSSCNCRELLKPLGRFKNTIQMTEECTRKWKHLVINTHSKESKHTYSWGWVPSACTSYRLRLKQKQEKEII